MENATKFIRFFLWLSVAITVLSCDKDNDSTTSIKTKTELLTMSSWKYTGATINPTYDYYGDGNAVSDIFSIMKPCERDDYEVYKTDGVWEYNEGPTKCDASSDQVFSDPWRFAESETKLIVGEQEHKILELNANTLKLQYSFEDAGILYTEVDSYSH